MSEQSNSSSRAWMGLAAAVIFLAFVFFVPVSKRYGYSRTTWDCIAQQLEKNGF